MFNMDIVEQIVAFSIEVIGTILGVYLGFRTGLNLNKRNRMEEDADTKKSLIDSLIVEIDYNIILMEKGYEDDSYDRKAFRYLLFKNSIDSSIASGFFLLLSTRSQNMIREYLGGINHMNSLTTRLDTDIAQVISRIYNDQTPLLPILLKLSSELKTQLTSEID